MSLYSDNGRYTLGNCLFNCLFIDLIICGFLLYLNLPAIIAFFQMNPPVGLIIAMCFLVYIAIITTVKKHLRRYVSEGWRQAAEIFSTIYLFLHGIAYIWIIGIFLLGVFLAANQILISSDLIFTLAILISAAILGNFYLKNKRYQKSARSTTDCYTGHSIFSPDTTEPNADTRCRNPSCNREINHKDIIQCGPCEQYFCKHCWETHQWSHGKAPAVGISYSSEGTFSGFDGTESMKK